MRLQNFIQAASSRTLLRSGSARNRSYGVTLHCGAHKLMTCIHSSAPILWTGCAHPSKPTTQRRTSIASKRLRSRSLQVRTTRYVVHQPPQRRRPLQPLQKCSDPLASQRTITVTSNLLEITLNQLNSYKKMTVRGRRLTIICSLLFLTSRETI